ncbi:MAG: hypothetical protein K6G30_02325 [Acetatifactor sp.]|nr:hypothetical protein [Acetatifactor sp.]
MRDTTGRQQSLFDFALMILTVKNMLDSTDLWRRPEWMDNAMIIAFMGLMIWKYMLQTYKKWQAVAAVIVGSMSIYTCFYKDYYFILFSFVLIFGMQNIKLEQTVKKVAIVKSSILAIHALYTLALYLVMPALVPIVIRKGVVRYAMFLGHPNTFSMYLLWNTFEYLYVYYEKLNKKMVLLLWGVNVLFYQFTDSNTSLWISSAVYIIVLVEKLSKYDLTKVIRMTSRVLFGIFGTFFWFLTAFYTHFSGAMLRVYTWLDKGFTGRLKYGAFAYSLDGLTFLGNNRRYAEKNYWRGIWIDKVIFDNAYIWLLVSYGTIYLIMIAVVFFIYGKRFTKKEALLIVAYSGYAVMENYIVNAAICFPILFIGIYLYKDTKVKERGKVGEQKNQYHHTGVQCS